MIKNILIFASGALVGAGSCFYFVKKHYDKKFALELDAIRKVYYDDKCKVTIPPQPVEISDETEVKPEEKKAIDITQASNKVELEATDYTTFYNPENTGTPIVSNNVNPEDDGIRVISRGEMGDCGYDKRALYLYADGVWVNEDLQEIELLNTYFDPKWFDFLETELNKDHDSIFLRDTMNGIDYGIYFDEDSFRDVEYHATTADEEDD